MYARTLLQCDSFAPFQKFNRKPLFFVIADYFLTKVNKEYVCAHNFGNSLAW